LSALEEADKDAKLWDFYDIGLWDYCAGNKTSDAHFNVDYCSPAKAMFWFDPETVWGLNGTGGNSLFSDDLKDGLRVYHKVSKWMFIAYMVAIISTAAELLVGISAIFSRMGSCITSIISSVSAYYPNLSI
jgi:SUR7/PalI family